MTEPRHDVDVLIVGAGPTGIVTALCLAACGVRSVIVERRDGLQTHPKAHELSARSIEILQGLGVEPASLEAEASPHDDASRVLFCGTLDEEFGRIDLAAGDGARKYRQHLASPRPYMNISQVEVERRLLARLAETPAATLRYRHQWESLTQGDHGVESVVTDLATGARLTVTSRYVVCADGAGSRTRAALGARMVGPEKLRDFVSAYIQADLRDVVRTRAKLYFIFSPKCPGSVLIAHHVERRWVLHVPVATPRERPEDFTAEVMAARARLAIGRDDVPLQVTSVSPWRMTAQVADRFRVGRCFLAGDAAHRFPPTGGLGMNSGIGDAHNLGWKLARVLRGESPASLLDTYESERRPVVQTNCDESRRNFEALTEIVTAFGLNVDDIEWVQEQMNAGPIAALPEPMRAWGRKQVERLGEGVLHRYEADPEVRARVTSAVARQRAHFDRIGLDLGYAYEEGALLSDGTAAPRPEHPVTDYVPSTRPGHRFPHFWLDGNGRAMSSHTLVDYARSTLVCGEGLDVDAVSKVAGELGVRVFSLRDEAIPECHRGAAHTHCQLERDGALLLRPTATSRGGSSGGDPDAVAAALGAARGLRRALTRRGRVPRVRAMLRATMRVPVPLAKAWRLFNHGPVTLVSAAHEGRENLLAAAWVTRSISIRRSSPWCSPPTRTPATSRSPPRGSWCRCLRPRCSR
ncbi:MAG: FAD-dependent monooxygenase [Polyangiales bacterium]